MYILICWSVAGRPGTSVLFLGEIPMLPAHTLRPEERVKPAPPVWPTYGWATPALRPTKPAIPRVAGRPTLLSRGTVACTPAAGWEKGQVENQVGNLRDLLFRPKPRMKSLTELNAWLDDQCIAYARRTNHPEFKERTIWDVFQDARASLMELRGSFDGFVEKAVRATTTCLIMADHNRYSVDARAAGRMVLVRSHAERIVVLFNDEVVADHPRQFRRDQIVYDPWHYLPVLVRKPGALRNGAPFKDWGLPAGLAEVRARL